VHDAFVHIGCWGLGFNYFSRFSYKTHLWVPRRFCAHRLWGLGFVILGFSLEDTPVGATPLFCTSAPTKKLTKDDLPAYPYRQGERGRMSVCECVLSRTFYIENTFYTENIFSIENIFYTEKTFYQKSDCRGAGPWVGK
jgi:hypothetical protein